MKGRAFGLNVFKVNTQESAFVWSDLSEPKASLWLIFRKNLMD